MDVESVLFRIGGTILPGPTRELIEKGDHTMFPVSAPFLGLVLKHIKESYGPIPPSDEQLADDLVNMLDLIISAGISRLVGEVAERLLQQKGDQNGLHH